MPLRALLDQFALDFPGFCKVGTGHNKKIDFDAKGFLAVTDSVHLLKKLKFDSIFVDEGHHPLPPEMPRSAEMYRFSATHTDEPDFRYTMGQAIEDGVLCDYDITVPALTAHHAYVCLGDLLLKQVGRFRRVLAYCNSIAEAKRFRMVLRELGLAAWHINGNTAFKKRETVIAEFAGLLHKPVHVLVTVEVLGEGINIPNADTCMFVEPRNSYRSIVQAIGRVLRHHPAKTLAHIILPALAIVTSRPPLVSPGESRSEKILRQHRTPEEASNFGGQLPNSDCEEGNWHRHARNLRSKSKAAISLTFPSSSQPRKVNPVSEPDGPQDCALCSKEAEQSEAKLQHKNGMPRLLEPVAKDMSHKQDTAERWLFPSDGSAKPGTCDPCEFDKPAAVKAQQTSQEQRTSRSEFSREIDEEPKVEEFDKGDAASQNEATLRQGLLRSKPLAGSQPDWWFGSQLERFLATLMLADHRLINATAGHRIQVADCTLEDGATMIKGLTGDIYSQLSMILSRGDHWEICFRDLEMFVQSNGRLPRRSSRDSVEKRLSIWLNDQNAPVKTRSIPLHRLQRLLFASSSLIRRRVQGWQIGDPDGRFGEKCKELRQYVQTNHCMPKESEASCKTLAAWLANLRNNAGLLSLDKKKMLQELHPLVKAEIQTWWKAPPVHRMPLWERQFGQLSEFVSTTGRLPRSTGASLERRCYNWLNVERRKLLAGYLPAELIRRLRSSHPPIAAYIDAAVQRRKAGVTAGQTKPDGRGF